MSLLNTVLNFAIMKSNPYVGGVLTVGKYILNKTKETPKMMSGFKTYTGILVAAAPRILSLFGYDMTTEGQGLLSDNLDAIVEIIGTVYALYGRFVANPVATKKK